MDNKKTKKIPIQKKSRTFAVNLILMSSLLRKISSLFLLATMTSLLVGKGLHMLSEEHLTHQCCTAHHDCSDCDTAHSPHEHHKHENGSDEGHAPHWHNCFVLDYLISNFTELETFFLDILTEVQRPFYSPYKVREYHATLLYKSSRAPPTPSPTA